MAGTARTVVAVPLAKGAVATYPTLQLDTIRGMY